MPQGQVKKLVADRGFGFIAGDKGDVFFHCSEVQETAFEELQVGQMVSYELGEGHKGPCALSVRIAAPAAS